jgi:hypothetical protein
VIELETSRTTESRASFVVGERVFHVVTEVVTVRSATGRIFSVFVSPIALLVSEPHGSYVVSFTDEGLTIEELLIRVPELKGKTLSHRDR